MKQSHILSKKFFFHAYRALAAVFSFVVMCGLGFALYLSAELPDRYYLAKGDDFSIGDNRLIQTAGSSRSYPLSVYSSAGNTFQMKLRLLGLIDIKDVSVQVVDRRVVSLCGTPFGIKMVTDGVMVVGTGSVTNLQSQAVNPAEDAGVLEGDVILSLNGQPISMVIRRGDELEQLTVSPVKSSLDNDYHLGLWVRDSSAGIGTMTFYDPQNGCFAGLGHAICDVDTGQIMPLSQGEIVEASIIGVDPGSSGDPGQLQGAFVAQKVSGLLYANSYNGVYGQLFDAPAYAQTIPMAQSQEVTEGPAQILTTISGETPAYFDAYIEKVSLSQEEPTKNMVIRITDPDLLEISGGIVQGMSGSPIIQDGMLVGAVTHV